MSTLLEQASLIMIPSGYKEDVVYSVIPETGAGDLSFTRASNGTRINSAGLVEVVSWNLALQSEDFTNAEWVLVGSSVSSNAIVAPNGTTTADKLVEDTSTGTHITLQINGNRNVSSIYSFSVYAKAGERTKINLFNNGNGAGEASFDLVNGTATLIAGAFATIENVGNGWYRCNVGMQENSTVGSFNYHIRLLDASGNASYTGNGTSGAYIWGAQINLGTIKPYFPTTDRLNVPRLTYQNGGGGCPSLLLEKQSTNLLSYSEDFSNAAWTKLNASVTANDTTSPDGTQNADKLIENTANDEHVVYRAIDGTSKTFSFYAKAAGRNWLAVLSNNGTYTYFNVSNGTLGTIAATSTATIEDAGNGWYRCTVYNTHATYGAVMNLATANGTVVYTGNGTSGVYLWGAQVEASSYPTSYIPTTSASATRVADGPVNLSTTQTLTNFTLFLDGLIFENGQNMFFGSGNSAWYIDIDGSIGRIVLDLASGRIYNAFSSLTSNQRFKLAVKRSAGVVDAFVNGTKLTPNTQVTDTTSLTLSSITWGFSSTYYPKMKVNEICAFQSALSDSDCQALTTL